MTIRAASLYSGNILAVLPLTSAISPRIMSEEMISGSNLDVTDTGHGNASSSYDQILYPSRAYTETHPDNLASVASLFGMTPPPVEKCRVLEVGCGDGSNLIPMAVSLPNSEFFGIDLATRPINTALDTIDRTKLNNISVQAIDLMDFKPSCGPFDYIIAHGFYSWVPPAAQEKLLAVCKQHLSPNGLAFVSYNAYPAGHLRTASREMMIFHLNRLPEPADRVLAGKDFLKLMAKSVEPSDSWKIILENESRRLDQRDARAIYHDDLNPYFSATYFADFVQSANYHSLQFVSDAKIRDEISPSVKPDVLAVIDALAGSDIVARQQYLDFVMFNGFHRSLLCHTGIQLERDQVAQRIARLWIASPLKRSGARSDGTIEFKNSRGAGTINTNNTGIIAVLDILSDIWPNGKRFEDLESHIGSNLHSAQNSNERASVMESLLKLAMNKLVDLRAHPAYLSKAISSRPVASPLARLQANRGTLITTLLHTHIDIEDVPTRRLLELLDGTRDIASLTRSLATQFPSLSAVRERIKTALLNFHDMGLLIS
jgi:methyltransferase-like protein